MYTIPAVIIGLLAPFILSASCAFLVVLAASMVVPPLGLLAGVIADAFYYTPSVSLPYATILGLCVSLFGFFVQHVIKTRIMGR